MRWMIIGLQSRREKRVEERKEEIPMKNLASKIQYKRLWRALREQASEHLIHSIMESYNGVEKPI